MSAIWLLTVSEVCGPRILVESNCPGTVINAETGTEVDDVVYTSVVGTAVVAWSKPTTGTMRGELLENKSVIVRQYHLATYLPADIWLSELRFMSIDDLDGCDAWRREENFPLNDRAILPMGLFLDGPSFDMMMVVVKDSWLPTDCVRKTKRRNDTQLYVITHQRHPLTTYVVLTPLRCITPVDTRIERCFQFHLETSIWESLLTLNLVAGGRVWNKVLLRAPHYWWVVGKKKGRNLDVPPSMTLFLKLIV